MYSANTNHRAPASQYSLGSFDFEPVSPVTEESTFQDDTPRLDNVPLTLSEDPLLSPESPAHNTVGNASLDPLPQIASQSPILPEHKIDRLRKRDWLLEIAALFISTASMISLFGLLLQYDGRPLESWTAHFSLNTIVSILSIAMKTPLAFVIGSCLGQGKWAWFRKRQGPIAGFAAFDEASRGPFGSLLLLWRFKSRHWASLGAWVTLALLAVDPFLQAVIMYPGEPSGSEESLSTAARASRLDIGDWSFENAATVFYKNQEFFKSYYLLSDIQTSATSLMGFVGSAVTKAIETPPVSCRTANCTWAPYASLGVCSTCTDISNRIRTEANVGMPDENQFSPCKLTSYTFVMNYTNFVVPYGPDGRLVLQRINGLFNQSICTGLDPKVAVTVTFAPQGTISFKDSERLLASFVVLQAEDSYWKNEIPWEESRVTATECSLQFCARMYDSQVHSLVIREVAGPDVSVRRASSFRPFGIGNQTLLDMYEVENGLSLSDGLARPVDEKDIVGRMGHIVPRHDLQLEIRDAPGLAEADRLFNVTQKSIVTWQDYFAQGNTIAQITYALANSTNITKSFENAAQLMTNSMRERDGGTVVGRESRWVVYIRIRWGFLVFPVISALAGLCFAVGAVVESRRLELPTLKTDAVAMLLHGLDSDTTALLRDAHRDRKADGLDILVKLEDGKEGLRLRSGD